MKRTTLLLTLVGMLLLAVGAGVAWAQDIMCTPDTQPCEGTPEEDYIVGGFWSDTIYGLGAADDLAPRGGNDTVYGGGGPDAVGGSFGDDTIYGEGGSDELRDTNGNDVDLMEGGPGNDGFSVRDGDNLDTVRCGSGKRDIVFGADRRDTILRNCEEVHRE